MLTELPWLDWLKSHIGESEFTGTKPTEFVTDCFRYTTYGKLDGATPPSCAATLCAALEKCGFKSPHSARALDFTAYGIGCALKKGAICVFDWGNGSHHVSVCDQVDDDKYATFVGGNQGHKLQPATFSRKYLIAVRWPVKA